MHEVTPSPYDEALKKMPRRFYELSYRNHIALTLAAAYAFQMLNIYFLHQESIPAHITAVSVYAISALADRLSTIKAMNTNNVAEVEGAVSGFQEGNMLIGDVKTAKDFLKSKRGAVVDVGALALASIYPGLGIGFAIPKFQAAANNLRAEKRIQLARTINRQ